MHKGTESSCPSPNYPVKHIPANWRELCVRQIPVKIPRCAICRAFIRSADKSVGENSYFGARVYFLLEGVDIDAATHFKFLGYGSER